MNSFANRVDAQREILLIVNAQTWQEELFGISRQAIQRWAMVNRIGADHELVLLLQDASEKLRFLANKSQEQVTDDYEQASDKILTIVQQLSSALQAFGSSR